MMVLQRRDGTTRPMTVQWWVGWLTLAAIAGGLATNGLVWLGNKGQSPGARLSAIEAEESRQDSVHMKLINGLATQLDDIGDLSSSMVAMRCLERDSLVAIRAQVPCARVLRDRGIRR